MRVSAIVIGACIGLVACGHPSSVARPAAPPDALGIAEKVAIERACGSGWAPLTEHGAATAPRGTSGEPVFVGPKVRPPDEVVISRVAITGVDPALAGTLEAALATRAGMTFGDAPLKADLARLLAMGITSDASIETDFDPAAPPANSVRGVGQSAIRLNSASVTFRLAPQPTIGDIELHGDADVLRRFALLRGAAFEPRRIWRMANALAQDYVRDGHLDAAVTVAHAARGGTEALCVVAKPGPRVTVASLTFPGRRAVSEAALRKAIHTEKFNHPGALFDQDYLDTDLLYVSALYWDHGYANVKVGSPRLTRHGARLAIEVPITEGDVFQFGTMVIPRLRTKVTLKSGDRFSRTAIADLRVAVEKELGVEAEFTSHVDTEHRRIDFTIQPKWRWPWQGLAHAFSP